MNSTDDTKNTTNTFADFLFRAYNKIRVYLPTDTEVKSAIVITVINSFGLR